MSHRTKDLIKSLGFKQIYVDESNAVHYMKYGKVHIELVLDNDKWTIEHDRANPDSYMIDRKAREIVSSDDIYSNFEIIEDLISWIEKVGELDDMDDLDELDEKVDVSDKELYTIKTAVPDIKCDRTRVLLIYVWGKKKRDTVPAQYKIEHNYNASVLYDKKKGVDWRKNGKNEEIRIAVMKGRGFYDFMHVIVNHIEKNNFHCIGINCSKGRHRSVTCAIILKKCFFPNAQLKFLEIK